MKDKTDEIFFGEGAEQLRMRIWGDDVPPDELAGVPGYTANEPLPLFST